MRERYINPHPDATEPMTLSELTRALASLGRVIESLWLEIDALKAGQQQ